MRSPCLTCKKHLEMLKLPLDMRKNHKEDCLPCADIINWRKRNNIPTDGEIFEKNLANILNGTNDKKEI